MISFLSQFVNGSVYLYIIRFGYDVCVPLRRSDCDTCAFPDDFKFSPDSFLTLGMSYR